MALFGQLGTVASPLAFAGLAEAVSYGAAFVMLAAAPFGVAVRVLGRTGKRAY